MKRICIDKHSTGYEKRIYQKTLKSNQLMAHYQDTWCELFKTKGYKKARAIQAKTAVQLNQAVFKNHGDVVYSIVLAGSLKTSDLQRGIDQAFLLTIH